MRRWTSRKLARDLAWLGVGSGLACAIGACSANSSTRATSGGLTRNGAQQTVTTPDGSARAGLRLSAYGCVGNAQSVGSADSMQKGARTEYRYARTGVTEWYESGTRGVEQGFTIDKAPVGCGQRDLEIEVAVAGLSPRLTAAGDGVDLVDERGAVRLHYTELSAKDATGRALPAKMTAADGHIALRVDTSGAAYPVVVDPLIWSERAKLVASDGANGDQLGSSVSLSGDTALIGDYSKTDGANSKQGAAYVFVRSGSTWSQQGGSLVANDGAANDYFGISVSLSGETALVGASNKAVGANAGQGAAYAFLRTGSTWAQQGGPLVASDGAANDNFGLSVAISGDTALVGASNKTVGVNAFQGAAYVFVRTGSTWAQQGGALTASDGSSNDYFGTSVSLSGDTALVGAWTAGASSQGAAYVFVRTGTTWAQQGPPLVANDGVGGELFGGSVSISGDTALVGARNKNAAYVFVRTGTNWALQGPALVASDAGANDQFGYSVSVAGNTAVVGASLKTIGQISQQGAAYVFGRNGSVWEQTGPRLIGSGTAKLNHFGYSVSVFADTVLVGADWEGPVSVSGAAYVFSDTCAKDLDCLASAYCTPDGKCAERCQHDSDCAGGSYCSADGSCQTQVVQGGQCDDAAGASCKEAGCAVCVTGHCADGVCCESACNGECEACAAKISTAADGLCKPIPAGVKPGAECEQDPDYPASCGAPGECDGARHCRSNAKPGTVCGATTCTRGKVSGEVCNGGGKCGTDTISCAPGVCDGDACGTACTTDKDCDTATGYCLKGTCVDKKSVGDVCQKSAECPDGFCTDGVCCESDCAAQCEACGEKNHEGKCIPVTGAPRGERAACDGDADVCGGACDGADVASCKYASPTTVCGQTCEDGKETQGDCDGNGACVTGSPRSCGAFACGPDACLTDCSADEDCASGYRCANSECVPTGGSKCSKDLTSSVLPDDTSVACAPYACDASSGACRTQCTSVDDCSPGNACDADKSCVPESQTGSSSDSGCGCRIAGAPRPGLPMLVLFGFGVALCRRRRTRLSGRIRPRCE
jgi:hypothetical protein